MARIRVWIGICTVCRANHARSSACCATCHAANMREWRKTHPMTAEQRMKDNARSYSGVLKRRGKLQQQPCEACGSADSQMHHEDYANPRQVNWLCRPCHLKHQRDEYQAA